MKINSYSMLENIQIDYKGSKFTVPANTENDIIVKALREGYVYDSYVVNNIKKHYVAGTCILDLGANYGQMAIEYSRIAQSDGHVYAFEANPVVFECLVQNISSYKLENVSPIFGAVAERVGDRLFFPIFDDKIDQTYGSLSLVNKRTRALPVSSITLDSIEYKLPVSCIKMDLQGYELFALNGGRGIISKYAPVIVFEYEDMFSQPLGITFSDYLRFLESVSYEIIEGPLNENEIKPKSTNICIAKPKYFIK